MPFPLESGTCRLVCRPIRKRQRRVNISAVVRFARAAVDDGAQPCDVVDAVNREMEIRYKANCIQCPPCLEEVQKTVDEALDATQEAIERQRSSLDDLFDQLDMNRGAGKKSVWTRLLKRLGALFNIIDLVKTLADVINAGGFSEKVHEGVAEALAETSRCIDQCKRGNTNGSSRHEGGTRKKGT